LPVSYSYNRNITGNLKYANNLRKLSKLRVQNRRYGITAEEDLCDYNAKAIAIK
jgi:hypothetical protein